jgi:hypothetical protein
MQQLWQNLQNFVNLSRGSKKPKLDEIFKNEFSIVYRRIQNAGSNKIWHKSNERATLLHIYSTASASIRRRLSVSNLQQCHQVVHCFIVAQAHLHRLFDNPKSTQVRSSGTMTRHYFRDSGNKFSVLPMTLKPRPKRNLQEYEMSDSTRICSVPLLLPLSQQNWSCQEPISLLRPFIIILPIIYSLLPDRLFMRSKTLSFIIIFWYIILRLCTQYIILILSINQGT